MREINLRGRKKRNIYPRATISVLTIIVLLLARATWNVFVKNKTTGGNLNEAIEDLESLKNREVELKTEIERLSTERGVDEEIRTKFRVVKEGEGMIVLVDSPDVSSTSSQNNAKSFWSKILDWF